MKKISTEGYKPKKSDNTRGYQPKVSPGHSVKGGYQPEQGKGTSPAAPIKPPKDD